MYYALLSIHITRALAGIIFLRAPHGKLRYFGEASLSFDVHYDSIFLHLHSNYRDNVCHQHFNFGHPLIKLISGIITK